MKQNTNQNWGKGRELLNSISEINNKEKDAIEGSLAFKRYADQYINNHTEGGEIGLVDLATVFREAFVMGLKHQIDW